MRDITIGVPAYNAEGTLQRAIESLVHQTHPVQLIHISDDASRDNTEQVGRSLAAKYGNVKYTKQPANIGRTANFSFLLQQADTQYFMWLAGDDHIDPTYVEKTSAVLEADEQLVACVSQVRFVRSDGTASLATGGWALEEDRLTNLATYLDNPSSNARFYALHRTEALKKSFPLRSFHAWDWAASAGTLLYGKHAELPEVLMTRDETPTVYYIKSIRRDNNKIPFGRILPLWPMTADLIFRQRIPLKWSIARAIIALNLQFHCDYMRFYHPRYGTYVCTFLERYVIWRFRRPSGVQRIEFAPPTGGTGHGK